MRELLRRTLDVARPTGEVWAHLAAVEQWPSWARHIRSATLEPPGALGPTSRGWFALKPFFRAGFKVTLWEPGRRWKWRGCVLWLLVDYDHVLEPGPSGGTRITLVVEGEGFALGSLGRFFARVYAGNLDRALPLLKRELEG